MSWTKSKWINSKICCYLSPWDISDPRSYEHYWTSSWNESWKKIQAHTRFEPMTSTNWANKPTGSWSQCWIQINFLSGEQWLENYTGSNWWNLKQASNLTVRAKGPLTLPLTLTSLWWKANTQFFSFRNFLHHKLCWLNQITLYS